MTTINILKSPSPRHGACVDCEYSEYDAAALPEPGLRCRRYAPRPGDAFVEWPRVRSEDWCGEYLERDHEEDDAAAAADVGGEA